MLKRSFSRILHCFICFIIILITITGCNIESGELTDLVLNGIQGYTYTIYEGEYHEDKGDSFLACGTDGRLDRIYKNKTVENIPLNGIKNDLIKIFDSPGLTLVSGQAGLLLYSQDGQNFSRCKDVTKADIFGLTSFKEKFYACTGEGVILDSEDGILWKESKKLTDKPIIAIAANEYYCMAITIDTDIFVSSDGVNWDLENFNTAYDGYYEKHVFTNIINFNQTFFILGFPMENPDCPLIMFSDSGGEVWMFKNLTEINDQAPEDYFPMVINDLCLMEEQFLPEEQIYFEEQILAACNNGRILSITSCSKCNKLTEDTSDVDFRSLALSNDKMIAVGNDFNFVILDKSVFKSD